MGNFNLIFLLTLIGVFSGVQMFQFIDDIQKVMGILTVARGTVNDTHGTAESLIDISGDKTDAKLDQIISKIEGVSSKLDNVENHLSNQMDNLKLLLTKQLRSSNKLDTTLRDLAKLINFIDFVHKRYLQHINIIDPRFIPSNHSVLAFVESAIKSDPGHLIDSLHQISKLMTSSGLTEHISTDLLSLMAEDSANNAAETCGAKLSAQQQLYLLYLMLIYTEKEGLEVLEYSYKTFQKLTNINKAWDIKIAQDSAKSRSEQYFKSLYNALKDTPRDIRPCDPTEHEREITFIEFEKLFGLYIVNEYDNLVGTCEMTCDESPFSNVDLAYSAYYNNIDLSNSYSSAFPAKLKMKYDSDNYCYGDLVNCKTLSSVDYCRIPGSARRFEWFKDINEKSYGNSEVGCNDGENKKIEWETYFWQKISKCEYCVCECNTVSGSPNGIIMISLMDEIADIGNNKIVTGIRFAMSSGIVHLQIKEGKLLPEGKIAESQWQPLKNITNLKNSWVIRNLNNGSRVQMNRYVDYSILSPTAKTLFLDDIILPNKYVVTGVRIKAENKILIEGEKSFYLEVLGTPYDYLTGQLTTSDNKNPSIWFSYKLMKLFKVPEYKRKRSEVLISLPDSPINSEVNTVKSHTNQYITFKHSDEILDAGQSVVPFLDAQPVESTPDYPLSGIALIYKGATGFGGFVAPKIFTYDFSPYLKPIIIKAN